MNNVLKGKKAKQSGEYFENVLQAMFKEYELRNIAVIDKINEERAGNTYRYKKKLRVDFIGYTKRYRNIRFENAVCVGIEAKQTLLQRFNKSLVKPHQLKYLHRLTKSGGLGLLVIGMEKLNKIFVIFVVDTVYSLFEKDKTTKSHTKNRKLMINEVYTKTLNVKELDQLSSVVLNYQNADVLGVL